MLWLIDFFKEIGQVIYKIFEFVIWLINSLVETVSLALDGLTAISGYAVQLPAVLASVCIAVVTISLIFKLKG